MPQRCAAALRQRGSAALAAGQSLLRSVIKYIGTSHFDFVDMPLYSVTHVGDPKINRAVQGYEFVASKQQPQILYFATLRNVYRNMTYC